jgi:hypothetical protein
MTIGVKARPDFSRETLLWLAGLLEGEGSFIPGPPSSPGVPRISVEMIDEDVIARAALALGNRYWRVGGRNDIWKPTYRTQLRGESAVRLMQVLRPMMGLRRQAQIDRALASWSPQEHRLRPEDEKRILQLVASGLSYRATGRQVGFSWSTVGNVVARNQGVLAQSGRASGRQPGGRRFESGRSRLVQPGALQPNLMLGLGEPPEEDAAANFEADPAAGDASDDETYPELVHVF